MKLTDNTILITGGSSGIGLALAKQFLALKNTVIVTGRSEARLAAAKAEHPGLITQCCDSAKPDDLSLLAKRLEVEFPELNVLINNAGVMRFLELARPVAQLEQLTEELWTNLAAPIQTVSMLIEQLKRNRGTIINVSSGLAFVPLPAAPVYSATKAALHSYTQSLRAQLSGTGVEVIELMPPAIKTNLADFSSSENMKVITTDELMERTFDGLRASALEIRPGQANLFYWLSRILPKMIGRELAKASAKLIPGR